jgi:hypothetical protein
MPIYYTITNKDETTTFGHQYTDGLNILDKKHHKYIHKRFYFTTAEHIHEYYHSGDNLRVVELPLNDPNFRIMTEKNGLFFSNMIILREKYNFNNLNDFKEIYKINAYKLPNIYNIEILEWLKSINYDFNKSIKNSARHGHFHLLEWVINSGIEFNYDEGVIMWVAIYGYVHVLEWFKNFGYKLKYDEYAIIYAAANGNIHILEWFKNFGYKLKYNKDTISDTIGSGYVHSLDWFKKNNYKNKKKYIKQYKH